jgi:hypothetical protein
MGAVGRLSIAAAAIWLMGSKCSMTAMRLIGLDHHS